MVLFIIYNEAFTMFTKKSYMKKWMSKKPVHTGWSYLCSYVDAEKRNTPKSLQIIC